MTNKDNRTVFLLIDVSVSVLSKRRRSHFFRGPQVDKLREQFGAYAAHVFLNGEILEESIVPICDYPNIW